jgi:cyclopropane fatty-acyl-phospholipid synthase-like methyltransferase
MRQVSQNYNTREFWITENRQYTEGNFRLRKCARLLNEFAAGRQCDLLDIGCGPATLRRLVDPNISYRGIDIALHEKAPYLREVDFVKTPLAFDGMRFDLIVALGVFEYMGAHQDEKFAEIRKLLKPGGKFILSYINFRHVRRRIYTIFKIFDEFGVLI